MQATDRNELLRLADRKQPQNIDAEEAIIGGCLLDQNAIARIADTLPAEAFYLAAHREIYRAMLVLHAEGKTTDVMTVLAWLSDRGLLQKIGGQSKLASLMRECVSAVNIDQHAALVNDKYFRRQIMAHGQELTVNAGDGTLSQAAIVELLQKEAYAFAQQQVDQGAEPVRETLQTVFNEVQERSVLKRPVGILSGFYDLDAMTQGFQRGDLIIEAGRPSMGKTAFLLNLLVVAAMHDIPVLLFSLEMSKEKLAYRLLASESRIETGRLGAGRITDNEWVPLVEHVNRLSSLPIWVYDKSAPSIADIRAIARTVQAEAGTLGMIGLDYLQLMELGDNSVQGLGRITKGLKGLARDFDLPVHALSQLSRGVESRTNKRPMMSDLRESGALEQDADLILMLYRAEYYEPDTPDRGIAELIISKHRNGPTGTVKLLFEPEFTQFRNLAGRRNSI
ncbi:MAG: replicative DNA helicase [Lyngbya sp. HA4199-MV5]|jgi:replicative DNA helicase|nr:replicative DNA helicase [Lyngbya sp. HA4199-MV5]